MLAADNWCVKVEDRVYGPYTSQQLRKFAHEGRFAPWSIIAPAGSRAWREARNETAFALFFGENAPRNGHGRTQAFGKRDFADDLLTPDRQAKPSGGRQATQRNGERAALSPAAEPRIANFIIVFDIVSAAASRVETAVVSLGPAFRVVENVWALSCELSAVGVRNAITPYLLPRESILVIDATRGRTSWQNFTPEQHAKLAAAWAAAL